ncbi:chymotrypsinogen A-like [Chironomus tepperi]|uniref:chymotrypsinogen A-like n=1 Tax=Chironomus tepperi TaxID=113505 RepID=UPI00391F822C
MSLKSSISIIILTFITINNAGRVSYLNGLEEDESCELSTGSLGECRKISDCIDEFESFRSKRLNILTICKYEKKHYDTLICCPEQYQNRVSITTSNITERNKNGDIFDYETCQIKLLKYREKSINPEYFANAISRGVIANDSENCRKLDRFYEIAQTQDFTAGNSKFQCPKSTLTPPFSQDVTTIFKGDRPNMAAIGWTKNDKSIIYRCAGSIVTERFIVTAAHCRYYDGIQSDSVRVGDRYLLTQLDNENAQNLEIERFFSHPNYDSRYLYNDIGLIKTLGEIIFSRFVTPACIADLDQSKSSGRFDTWTVAGYGQTEDRIPKNTLLEVMVTSLSNEDCGRFYASNPYLPNGIHESQICIRSVAKNFAKERYYPDSCFGDSGSPLQFRDIYETFPENFNVTLISDIYKLYTVLGVVSFANGDCSFNSPSIYTNVYYYRDWIRKIMNKN